MTDKKCCRGVCTTFMNFFKKSNGRYDKMAITFTILNVVASFFFLNSIFNLRIDLTDLNQTIWKAVAMYILFSIGLGILGLLVISLKTKFVKLNINLFLLFYLIFQLPTLSVTTAIFFILVALALYNYVLRQKGEVNYAKKINIHRRLSAGFYLLIFVSSLSMAIAATRDFGKREINDVINDLFIENGQVKAYMMNVYDKYLEDEHFYKEVDRIKSTMLETPEKILETLNTLPRELLDVLSPDAAKLLQGDDVQEKLDELRTKVFWSIDQIQNNVSDRDILLDRMINVATYKVKTLIAPYERYIIFYFGYSIFAILIIISPLLLILLKWIVALVFVIMRRSGVIKVIIEKQDVETIRLE